MTRLDDYVSQILRHTYLSKREKRAWKEEMLSHLVEAKTSAENRGLTEDEAIAKAMAAFGTVREVRRRIVRETYGVPPYWFVSLSIACLVVFGVSLFANMRWHDVIPGTTQQIPTPKWVLWWNDNPAAAHAQLFVGLAVVFFMLVYTRKSVDRAAVFASLAPFVLVWFLGKLTHQYSLHTMVFASWPILAPFGASEFVGYVLLLIVCLALYLWTRNRAVSLVPWILSIVLTVWPILRDTVQTALWHLTDNPIFWGHAYPDSYFLWWSILTIMVRCVVLALFMFGCRRIDLLGLRETTAA
ncbi:permease prefix domain 1-containing protein [Alicyclobacillus acidiphilus]|uniref:permease prefix domain 1-containing protein n=1 Tax=Alicyclobacillus acidiphilus TaxID=182455 RepID=UPI0008352EF3|nr:permease prefix domain 1-containing protein [Alicyclobacillus acidiphilus]